MSAITKLADSVFASISVVPPGASGATFAFRKHALEVPLETRNTFEGGGLRVGTRTSHKNATARDDAWRAVWFRGCGGPATGPLYECTPRSAGATNSPAAGSYAQVRGSRSRPLDLVDESKREGSSTA